MAPSEKQRGEHRKPPLHPKRRGWCRWCGRTTPPRLKANGELHGQQRVWHDECLREYHRAIQTALCVRDLVKDRGRQCASCGCERSAHGFEVDHIRPLWQSEGLSFAERRKFFELDNLQLLCLPCHKRKSAAEAKQRAKEARLRGDTGKDRKWKRKIQGRSQWPKGRKLPSRPFQQRLL